MGRSSCEVSGLVISLTFALTIYSPRYWKKSKRFLPDFFVFDSAWSLIGNLMELSVGRKSSKVDRWEVYYSE
jgi:hypothetical protein